MKRSVDLVVSAEMEERLKRLPKPIRRLPRIEWTAEEDALLLREWEAGLYRKRDLARLIGHTDQLCRDRYRMLKEG
jgi:hypothetical protein